jgi:hypothetical protein
MSLRQGNFRVRARRLAALTVLALVSTSPVAAAQTAQEGYSTPGGTVQNQVQAGGPTGSPTSPARAVQRSQAGSTSLPFSGLDLVFLLGAGTGLFVVGVGLRRVTQGEDPSR